MTDQRVEGVAKKGVGRLQDAVGGLIGDDGVQLKGKLNEAAGAIQDTYGQVKERAQDVFGDVRDYAQEEPIKALAIGLGVGLALGLLLWGGRKVVYVRE
jgi:uncharacterized protein YjbJ (UPF0337 family)